jgi:hypothetical protein
MSDIQLQAEAARSLLATDHGGMRVGSYALVPSMNIRPAWKPD